MIYSIFQLQHNQDWHAERKFTDAAQSRLITIFEYFYLQITLEFQFMYNRQSFTFDNCKHYILQFANTDRLIYDSES